MSLVFSLLVLHFSSLPPLPPCLIAYLCVQSLDEHLMSEGGDCEVDRLISFARTPSDIIPRWNRLDGALTCLELLTAHK